MEKDLSPLARGIFITFEGCDGSGKSTQIGRLANHLAAKGKDCVITREPGGTRIGEILRDILKDPALNHIVSDQAELLLIAASRAQHVSELIIPELNKGKIVLCDRFSDSTLAYQGYARGINLRFLERLNEFACANIKPDLTILLDLPPETSLQRADDRRAGDGPDDEFGKDRFEELDLSFHQSVRDGFLKIASHDPTRVKVISAAGKNVEDTHNEIISVVENELGPF